jgi:hypothetical protein
VSGVSLIPILKSESSSMLLIAVNQVLLLLLVLPQDQVLQSYVTRFELNNVCM